MSHRKYKIGEIVDVDFDNKTIKRFFLEHDLEVRSDNRTWVKEFGEVVDEFGVVSRVKSFDKGTEIDVHSKYMRLNKKHYRDKRLKKLLN